jgi:hypothetical protein
MHLADTPLRSKSAKLTLPKPIGCCQHSHKLIRKILEAGTKNAETKQYFQEYVMRHHHRVYRRLPPGKVAWVVPRAARWQIVRLCHDQAGHLGVENTLRRIQQNYYFLKMRRFVTKYIRPCLNCTYYKNCTGKKQGKLHPIEKVAIPFHTIHVDHVGPFQTSKHGNKFLFVVVDAFTKFTVIEPVKSTKVKHVTRIKNLTSSSSTKRGVPVLAQSTSHPSYQPPSTRGPSLRWHHRPATPRLTAPARHRRRS